MSNARPSQIITRRLSTDTAGQSDVLGVVLLLGLVLVGTSAVVVLGGGAFQTTQGAAEIKQAEQAMTLLDSKASLVAHGSSDVQRVQFTRGDGETVRVDEDGAWLRVQVVNETTGAVQQTVLNESLGTATYERNQVSIAYEGGGVWRAAGTHSSMVSPPEFHYRQGTLTLPLILVRGASPADETFDLRQVGATTARFPNASTGRANPLRGGAVDVTVRSDYYEAWGAYFESRTSGTVTLDHASETATIRLTTPSTERFDNAVATTRLGGITVNGNRPPPSPSTTGVTYASPDARIEARVADCRAGGCLGWRSAIGSPGTYYAGASVGGDLTIDTSGGDVALVVDGSFTPGDVAVTGDNNVTVYVRRNFAVNGEVNSAPGSGDAGGFRTLVHSDGDVDLNGKYQYTGLIYAPGSDIDFNGGGPPWFTNVVGGVVGETVTLNGNPNKIQYDPAVAQVTFDLGPDTPKILFLHVSTTTVEVRD